MKSFFIALCLLAFTSIIKAQATFCECASTSTEIGNIWFLSDLNFTINDQEVDPNDGIYILAVSAESSGLECAGSVRWYGDNTALATVAEAEMNSCGYTQEEAYKFIVELPNGCLLDSVEFETAIESFYDNLGFFRPNSDCKITSLKAYGEIDTAACSTVPVFTQEIVEQFKVYPNPQCGRQRQQLIKIKIHKCFDLIFSLLRCYFGKIGSIDCPNFQNLLNLWLI